MALRSNESRRWRKIAEGHNPIYPASDLTGFVNVRIADFFWLAFLSAVFFALGGVTLWHAHSFAAQAEEKSKQAITQYQAMEKLRQETEEMYSEIRWRYLHAFRGKGDNQGSK